LTGQKTRRFQGFGSVYRRGNFWTIDYRNEDGKRIQKAILDATTFDQALFALQQEVSKGFQVRHGQRPRREAGFQEFAEIFLNDCMITSRRNFRSDRYRLETLKEFFKDTDLRQITPLMIERFRKLRLEKWGNSKSTTNRYLALLKRLLNVAIQEGLCEQNPVKAVKLFSESDTLKERILTPEEEERLLAASSGHLRPILITALNTGARSTEILSLTWDRVNLEEREIRFERCKNGRLRHVPMNEILFKTLTAWKSGNGQNPYVFADRNGRPFKRVEKSFATARKRAGISGFRFHDTRHTFASRLIQRGCDLSTAQALLGHSRLATLQRYLHSTDSRKREAVSLLEKTPARDSMVTERKTAGVID
jgi:integrase